METPKTSSELQGAKRLIAQKSKEFESRLMKARNAFEQIAVLNDMTELIDAEVFQWSAKLEAYQEDPESSDTSSTEEAIKHITDLSEFGLKLNEHRKVLLPQARVIQQAMINSHQLKAPII